MLLPKSLSQSLAAKLGTPIIRVEACSGGDINRAARIITAAGSLFVKWHDHSPPSMFSAESKGLALLHHSKTVCVPQVVAVQEAEADCPAYLILEWLEEGATSPATDRRLGQQLAALHQITADQHGLDHANFIGSLPQQNHPHTTWAKFYAEQRLRPQMEIARQNGRLSHERENLLNRLLQRLPELLPDVPASLLHGDLWRGNVMTLASGEPAVIDPAVYYGHREVEIAFTQLFGGFSRAFYEAYNEVFPLDPSYSEHRDLYQLYPLMVHLNLFGGSYASGVDTILRRYAG